MPTVTSIGGHTLAGSGLHVGIVYGTAAPGLDVLTSAAAGRAAPRRIGQRRRPREIPIEVTWDGTITLAAFAAKVGQWFAPQDGPRTLLATGDDGTTAMQMTVDVLPLVHTTATTYAGTLLSHDGYFESTATSTDAASPLTVAGDLPATPVITVTPSGSTVRRRQITVTDRSGLGLVNYLVRAGGAGGFDTSGVGVSLSSHYDLRWHGAPIPFRARNWGAADTQVDFRVSVPPLGSTTLDLFYGSSVNNTLTNQQLNTGGMALDHASFSNDLWVWDDFSSIPTNPPVAGAWFFSRTYGGGGSGSATATAVSLNAGGSVGYDSLMLVTGVPIDAAATLDGLRVTSSQPGGLLIRYPGSTGWVTVQIFAGIDWTTVVPNVYAGPWSIGGATVVSLYVASQNVDAAIVFDKEVSGAVTDSWRVALDAALTPTVSVAAAATWHRLHGTALTNTTTGDTISFTDVYAAGDIVIDCANKTTTPDTTYGSILPSNAAAWFDLPVGANAWTNPTNGSASLEWRSRYAV